MEPLHHHLHGLFPHFFLGHSTPIRGWQFFFSVFPPPNPERARAARPFI
jgi:hypothetical protein